MNFDPGDTDLVRLLMMSVDTEEDATPAANELVLTEVQPPVFLAKVTAKTIQHVLRDEPAVKNNFILRDVTGSNLEDGTFDFELDLMPQIKYKDAGELLENKIFPLVKENIQDVFHSYSNIPFQKIIVTEKNSGKKIMIQGTK